MDRVRVQFACNDWRNGMATDVCSGVSIDGPDGEIDAEWCGFEIPMTWDGALIVLDGEPFLVRGRSNWVGNWCWDGTTMTGEEALRLARWLIARGELPDSWCPDTPVGKVVERRHLSVVEAGA